RGSVCCEWFAECRRIWRLTASSRVGSSRLRYRRSSLRRSLQRYFDYFKRQTESSPQDERYSFLRFQFRHTPRLLNANDNPSSSIAMFTVRTVTSAGTEI